MNHLPLLAKVSCQQFGEKRARRGRMVLNTHPLPQQGTSAERAACAAAGLVQALF